MPTTAGTVVNMKTTVPANGMMSGAAAVLGEGEGVYVEEDQEVVRQELARLNSMRRERASREERLSLVR